MQGRDADMHHQASQDPVMHGCLSTLLTLAMYISDTPFQVGLVCIPEDPVVPREDSEGLH